MLKKVEVKDPGDSELLLGEIIDLNDIKDINENLSNDKKRPVSFERVLLGITKASYKQILLYLQLLSKKQQEF